MYKWPNLNMTGKEIQSYNKLIKKIKDWILNKVRKSNCNGIVLGISGGVDSATLAIITKEIFGSNAHFYYLQTQNDKKTYNHVLKLNEIIKNIEFINVKNEFDSFCNLFSLKEDNIKANAKSRFFMNYLYTKAQKNNCLVLGTDNFNEYYLGYFTKWGDGACDLLPFANILKSDVYKIATIIGVPNDIIKKQPSANLISNKSDEQELGFSYEEFEKYIADPNSLNIEVINKINNLYVKTKHKRSLIPKGPKLK